MARFYVEMPLEGVVRLKIEIPDDEVLDEEGKPVASIVLEDAAAIVDGLLDLRVDHVDVDEYEINAAWRSPGFVSTIERLDLDDVPEAL